MPRPNAPTLLATEPMLALSGTSSVDLLVNPKGAVQLTTPYSSAIQAKF